MEAWREELYHYGIPRRSGRYPWGSGDRPYQGEERSKRAKKLLSSKSGEKVYRSLKREIRRERAKQYGRSNRWMHNKEIGPKSKSIRNEYEINYNNWKNSREFKSWSKEFDRLDDLLESQKISTEEYDKQSKKLWKRRPKKNFTDLSFAISYSNKGREYVNGYLNKGGKQLSIARLEDLGYDSKDAERLVEKMIKANRTLGNI